MARHGQALAAAALLALLAAAPAAPAGEAPAPGAEAPRYGGRITVAAGQTRLLRAPGVERVAVGDGQVLDVKVLEDAGQVLLIARKPGLTDLRVWAGGRQRAAYLVEVTAAAPAAVLEEVRARIADIEGVEARVVGGKVVIEGQTLRDEDQKRIETLVREHQGTVVSEVRPPRLTLQAMIEFDTRVVEVGTDVMREVGVRWTGLDEASFGGPRFGVLANFRTNAVFRPAPDAAFSATGSLAYEGAKSFAGWDLLATSVLRLLETHGFARQLAAPRLVCRSGGKAEFLAGGEVPVVVTTGLGAQDVVYKQYGIRLLVQPVADPAGYVASAITVEVSEIDEKNSRGGFPAFRTRRTSTDVNLRRGETLVISGLLKDNRSKNVRKVPGLGHLPILGELFKSRRFLNSQTELVVLMTPRVIAADGSRNRRALERARALERSGLEAVRFRLMD